MKKLLFVSLLVFTISSIVSYILVMPSELFNFSATTLEERLPENSLNYVEANFPNQPITDIDLEFFGFEVYLLNGTSIDFRWNGTVDSIDTDD